MEFSFYIAILGHDLHFFRDLYNFFLSSYNIFCRKTKNQELR